MNVHAYVQVHHMKCTLRKDAISRHIAGLPRWNVVVHNNTLGRGVLTVKSWWWRNYLENWLHLMNLVSSEIYDHDLGHVHRSSKVSCVILCFMSRRPASITLGVETWDWFLILYLQSDTTFSLLYLFFIPIAWQTKKRRNGKNHGI